MFKGLMFSRWWRLNSRPYRLWGCGWRHQHHPE